MREFQAVLAKGWWKRLQFLRWNLCWGQMGWMAPLCVKYLKNIPEHSKPSQLVYRQLWVSTAGLVHITFKHCFVRLSGPSWAKPHFTQNSVSFGPEEYLYLFALATSGKILSGQAHRRAVVAVKTKSASLARSLSLSLSVKDNTGVNFVVKKRYPNANNSNSRV